MPKYIRTELINNQHFGYKTIELSEYKDETQFLADYNFVFQQVKNLLGKVLTVVDATYTDKEQRKAIKDIIKGHWSDAYCQISDMMYDQKALKEMAQVDSIPEEVDVENL